MSVNSIPAIVSNPYFRAAQARSLARAVNLIGSQDEKKVIAKYGEFAHMNVKSPFDIEKSFLRTVSGMRDYQNMIEPLRSHRAELDEFDNLFAANLYSLVKGVPLK